MTTTATKKVKVQPAASFASKQSNGQASDKTAIRPFHINVADTKLVGLRRRINATRWPDRKR